MDRWTDGRDGRNSYLDSYLGQKTAWTACCSLRVKMENIFPSHIFIKQHTATVPIISAASRTLKYYFIAFCGLYLSKFVTESCSAASFRKWPLFKKYYLNRHFYIFYSRASLSSKTYINGLGTVTIFIHPFQNSIVEFATVLVASRSNGRKGLGTINFVSSSF